MIGAYLPRDLPMPDTESRQRARRIQERRGLAGVANDTKWGEFFALLPRDCRLRAVEVKLIDEDHAVPTGAVWVPSPNYIEGSGGLGPELFVLIEWIRFSETQSLPQTAAAVGLECVVSDGMATVYGYR